jgi:hypothetical protein
MFRSQPHLPRLFLPLALVGLHLFAGEASAQKAQKAQGSVELRSAHGKSVSRSGSDQRVRRRSRRRQVDCSSLLAKRQSHPVSLGSQ